jgi:quinol monooxygenase YgiN
LGERSYRGVAAVTVIAKLKVKSGYEEQLYERLRNLVAPTRAEEGCINYDLHRSLEDPGTCIFYVNWESRPLWEQHMVFPHLNEFPGKQAELTETWELFLGEKVWRRPVCNGSRSDDAEVRASPPTGAARRGSRRGHTGLLRRLRDRRFSERAACLDDTIRVSFAGLFEAVSRPRWRD